MEEKLKEWMTRLDSAQTGHYAACEKYQKINNLLGIPLVVLSSFVSAFLFFNTTNLCILTFLKGAGMIVAILAAVQTFIRPSEKSEKHRTSATKYGGLKRKVEMAITHPPAEYERKLLTKEIVAEWNAIAESAPVTPHSLRTKIPDIWSDDAHRKTEKSSPSSQ